MKRGVLFNCGHPGAQIMYCSTFADIKRVKLCLICTKSINDNARDPRAVGVTITDAVNLRNGKHHTFVPDPGSTINACNQCGEVHD